MKKIRDIVLVVYYINRKNDLRFTDLSQAAAGRTGTTAFGGIRLIAGTYLEP